MAYNGWSNRETWVVNVWFNPESAADVDYARETIENDKYHLPGYLRDMIDINAINWTELRNHFSGDETDETDED